MGDRPRSWGTDPELGGTVLRSEWGQTPDFGDSSQERTGTDPELRGQFSGVSGDRPRTLGTVLRNEWGLN